MTEPDTLEVRVARPEDYDAIADLVASSYARLFELGPYEQVLRDVATRAQSTEVLVAVHEQQILGTVTFAPYGSGYDEQAGPDDAAFRMLAVSTDARRRGVGQILVRACVERARALGARRLLLSTDPTMVDAQRLYEQLGFVRDPDHDWRPAGSSTTLLAYVLTL